MTKCEAKKNYGGVYVRTYSAAAPKSPRICNLNGQGAVCHIVEIENLRLYSADVICSGLISSDPQLVRFLPVHSSISGVTSRSWTGSTGLGQRGKHQFSHVKLATLIPGGDEIIRTEVVIQWPERGTSENTRQQFTVET